MPDESSNGPEKPGDLSQKKRSWASQKAPASFSGQIFACFSFALVGLVVCAVLLDAVLSYEPSGPARKLANRDHARLKVGMSVDEAFGAIDRWLFVKGFPEAAAPDVLNSGSKARDTQALVGLIKRQAFDAIELTYKAKGSLAIVRLRLHWKNGKLARIEKLY
jgi:hypothetical protein